MVHVYVQGKWVDIMSLRAPDKIHVEVAFLFLKNDLQGTGEPNEK